MCKLDRQTESPVRWLAASSPLPLPSGDAKPIHGRRDSCKRTDKQEKSPSKRLRRLNVGPRRASRALVHDGQATAKAFGQWLRVLWWAQTTDGAETLCAL